MKNDGDIGSIANSNVENFVDHDALPIYHQPSSTGISISDQLTQKPMNPTYLDRSYWTRHRSAIGIGAYASFILMSMITAILIIDIVLGRARHKPCKLVFKKALKHPMIGSNSDSHPRHVAAGYFNHDNHLDLAVAISDSGNIGIFLGYDNGSFSSQTTYRIGLESHPYWLAVADFNNNKKADIAVADYGTNSIAVLFGDGNGSFADLTMTSLGSSCPRSLIVGDFNDDNRTDIAVVTDGTFNVIILRGLGDGSFQIESTHYMGYDSSPYAITGGDFNNDNQLDFAVVNYGTSNLVILLSDGNRTFTKQQYSTGVRSQPSSIIVGDINDDDILDILITNSGTSNIGIFYGQGNATFRNLVTHSTGSYSRPWFLVLGDFDSDNIQDIAVAANDQIIIFKEYGHENFSIVMTQDTGLNSNPYSIAVADFDHDKKPDIVVTNYKNNNLLLLLLYDITATANPMFYSTGPYSTPSVLALADINADQQLDIIVSNLVSKNIVMFTGFGNGSFSEAQIIVSLEDYDLGLIAVGDFNNDNETDIVLTLLLNSLMGILLGENHGNFTFGGWYLAPDESIPTAIIVADINNDNHLDIITTSCYMDSLVIFFGQGDGTFNSRIAYYTGNGSCPRFLAVADLNYDHLPDLAVPLANNFEISVYLGYANGSFQQSMVISTGNVSPWQVLLVDLNDDQQYDLVFLSSVSFKVGVCLGDGNGTFGDIITYSTGEGSFPSSMIIDDFNQDARLDIIVANGLDENLGIFLGYGNGTLGPLRIFATNRELSPRFLVSADFNNDHKPDIVVNNLAYSTIAVLLTDVIVTFRGQANYFTGSGAHPFSITTGYLNNDSRLDIAVVNSGDDNVQVFLNDHNGMFLNGTTKSTGLNSHPQSVIIADFNRDGRFDIATTNFRESSIDLFYGFGNGTLDDARQHSTGPKSFPTSMAVGDLNNDSWIDLIVANQGTDNIGIFLGFHYATFLHYDIETVTFSMPFSVVTADFNNDAQTDFAVAHSSLNFVSIYFGYGNGSFLGQMTLETNHFPNSICVGDFNQDTHLDIAVTTIVNTGIGIFLSYGNGTFAKQRFYPMANGPLLIPIATDDFNNDNILDLVVAARDLDYIGVSIGHGDGTFADQMIYYMPNGSLPSSVVVSDFNNDTIRDIVVANRNRNQIGIFFGYGNGTFRDLRMYPTGRYSGPCSIAVGDFNRDNRMDIAVANQYSQTIGVFLNYGKETFSPQLTYSPGAESSLMSVTIGDLNDDSILDIVFADEGKGNGHIGVLYGYGDGTFLPIAKIYSTGYKSTPRSIAITDLNNDGRVDMVVTNVNINQIGILLRDKSESFGTQTVLSTGNGSQPIAVAVSDLNNDQQLDIAVANYGTSNVGIFLGCNNSSFVRQAIYSVGDASHPTSIAIADLNNDTQPDIVVTNNATDDICILFGDGNGIFTIGARYSTRLGSAPSFVAVGDLNQDNYFDLVIANRGLNNILVFFGLVNGNFSSPDTYSLDYNTRPQSIAIGDLNDDNLLDIAVANYGTNSVDILFQTCQLI